MAFLAEQTCKDFEVLVYHDGPKASGYEGDLAGGAMHPETRFFNTPHRVGDWGHTGRDLGIRAARGRWIIHTNADNVFYPSLVAVLKAALTDPQPWVFADPARRYPFGLNRLANWLDRRWNAGLVAARLQKSSDPQILIYAVLMRGMVAAKSSSVRVPTVAERQGIIFGGVPVRRGQIDAMQLVMQRSLWLVEGGWHDRSMSSAGIMYEELASKYRVLAVPKVLGEHW